MIHLKNATYIEWQTFEPIELDIWVEEGLGKSFSFQPPPTIPNDLVTLDCSGMLVMRNLVNAHHHAYSALATGMPMPDPIPVNFLETLRKIWWRLDRALDASMIRSSALVTAVACAKAGCTFAIDHHSSPEVIAGSLDLVSEAFEEVGLHHLLCYEITDRNGKEGARAGLEESRRYLSKRQGLVGLHASFTVEDETLHQAVGLASEYHTGIHVHLAEDAIDESHCRSTWGKSVVERFAGAGVLQLKGNIFAHGIHLNATERRLIAQSDSWLVANYDSNLNNGVGVFTGTGLGPKVMLGTDGMHSDMIAASQTAWFTGKGYEPLNLNKVFQRMQMAHLYLAAHKFEGNSDNNLVVLNYQSPTPVSQANFASHWFYGLRSSFVEYVISDGRLVVDKGRCKLVDEEAVMAEAREHARRLWSKL